MNRGNRVGCVKRVHGLQRKDLVEKHETDGWDV